MTQEEQDEIEVQYCQAVLELVFPGGNFEHPTTSTGHALALAKNVGMFVEARTAMFIAIHESYQRELTVQEAFEYLERLTNKGLREGEELADKLADQALLALPLPPNAMSH